MKRMTAKEWNVLGEKMFGKQRAFWRFRCPSCQGIQSPIDFVSKKGHRPTAALFLCKENFKPYPKIVIEKPPCRFNAFEQPHPEVVTVVNDDDKAVPTFPFAESGIVEPSHG